MPVYIYIYITYLIFIYVWTYIYICIWASPMLWVLTMTVWPLASGGPCTQYIPRKPRCLALEEIGRLPERPARVPLSN